MNRLSPRLSTSARTLSFVGCMMLPGQAAGLLLRHRGLRAVAALPMLVNIVLYVALMALAFWWIARWEPSWLREWHESGVVGLAAGWVVAVAKWAVAAPVVLVVVYFTFTTVGMVIAAPFNDVLSGRVEAVLSTGASDEAASMQAWTRQMVATTIGSIRLLMLQILLSLLVLPFLLIPVVGFLPLFLVTAYFGGLAMIDVAVARHDPTVGRLRRVLPGRRWQALALGVGTELLFFVPLVAMLVLPLGVIAGTMLYVMWDAGDGMRETSREER